MKDDDLNLDDLSLEDEFGGETREDKSDKAVEEIRSSEKAKELDEVIQRKLRRAAHLIDAGEFDDAKERLAAIEKDEEDRTGDCEIAEIYYLRLFLDYKVRTEDELVDYLVGAGVNLEDNKNYRLYNSCAREGEEQKMTLLKKRINDKVSDIKAKAELERQRKLREAEERRLAEEERQRKIREEEERQRKIREEEERKRREEEERQRKIREEEERKRREEEERQRKIREEEERKRREEEERQRKIREEEERKRREEEERQRKLAAEAKAKEEAEKRAWNEKIYKSLKHVSAYIELGKFDEAESALKKIEEEIIKTHGSNDIADTYYYRIYLEYNKKTEQDLVAHLAKKDINIAKNNNYIMAKSFAEGDMAKKVLAIENGVKEYKKQAKKKAEEERKAKEEAEQRAREEAEKQREAELERVRRIKAKKAKKTSTIIFVTSMVVLVVLLIVALAVKKSVTDSLWPGVLQLITIYDIIMLAICVGTYISGGEDGPIIGFCLSVICCVLGGIAAIVLLCLKYYAIWGWALGMAFFICNFISFIVSKVLVKTRSDISQSETDWGYMVLSILGIIFLVIAFIVVGARGWGLYF